MRTFPIRWILASCLALSVALPLAVARSWVGTWATAAFPEVAAKEGLPLGGATLRQIVHVSAGGERVRLRLSNAFGATPLVLRDIRLALAKGEGGVLPGTVCALRFNGADEATIPPGAVLISDPVDFRLPALSEVAITMRLAKVPVTLTTHPGSRTTSYFLADADPEAPSLSGATRIVHWYFLSGLDVETDGPAAAVVVMGDSITDGYGTTTDGNNRWTDELARLLHERDSGTSIAVLNQGIGGNRLLRDGLGPSMLARLDRDVLAQTGVKWVIILAGINDIGTRQDARKRGEPYANASDVMGALSQLIVRCRSREVRVFGGTLTPFSGAGFYWSEDAEADRQAVNQWIRTSGEFDAVIDFDAALRNPEDPIRLAPAFDSGDHLHPSLAGYAEMARTVDRQLFTLRSSLKP